MRFMITVHAAGESGKTSPARQAFHEQLARAGVLLDAGEYTLIEVRSREEALEWARRFPVSTIDVEIELRSLHEPHEPDRVDRVKALAR